MRDRVVRGGAIAAAGLVVLAAACSSSGSGKVGAQTTTNGSSTTAGDSGPGGSGGSGGSTSSSGRNNQPTTTGTGVPVTGPNGTITTDSNGNVVTTPPNNTQPTLPLHTTTTVQYILQWKFAVDYRTHPETNPFAQYQGGPRVWSLRESRSLARDGNYDLLTSHDGSFGAGGVAGWYGNNSSGCINHPAIAANTVDAPATVCGVTIPGHATVVYPSSSHMAVVQWTSLFDANVTITSAVADLDGCGDGVRYYIDKGTTELNAMTLTRANAAPVSPITTAVTFGQTLNFIIDAGAAGNSDCDATQLVIEIDRIQGT